MKSAFFEEISPAGEWNDLARKICKRHEENKLINQQVLDEIDESEEDYDDEEVTENSNESVTEENAEMLPQKPKEQTTKKPVSSTKAPKEKSTAKPKTTSAPPAVVDSDNENDESEADDDYDYSEDDDDNEDRENEIIISVDKPDQRSKDILMNGIKVIKEVENRIFGKRLEETFVSDVNADNF